MLMAKSTQHRNCGIFPEAANLWTLCVEPSLRSVITYWVALCFRSPGHEWVTTSEDDYLHGDSLVLILLQPGRPKSFCLSCLILEVSQTPFWTGLSQSFSAWGYFCRWVIKHPNYSVFPQNSLSSASFILVEGHHNFCLLIAVSKVLSLKLKHLHIMESCSGWSR